MSDLVDKLHWEVFPKEVLGYGHGGYHYNPHVCIAEGSLVHTPLGCVAIEECLPGMPIYQCDEDKMSPSIVGIRNVYDNGVQSTLRIISNDGNEIAATADHKFLFENGWSSLKEVTGMVIKDDFVEIQKYPMIHTLDEFGEISLSKVIDVVFAGNVLVYDVEVDSIYHNFICEGFVTHNSKPVALEPIGEEGGYHYFGPPPDYGGSYGLYTDGSSTIATQRAEEVFSPASGGPMKFIGPTSFEDVQKALKGSKFANLLHSCGSCGCSYVSSADCVKSMSCIGCGRESEYGNALMRGRNAKR